jgi:hypothetical protein
MPALAQTHVARQFGSAGRGLESPDVVTAKLSIISFGGTESVVRDAEAELAVR